MRLLSKGFAIVSAAMLAGCYNPKIDYINQPCLIPLKGFDFKLCNDFNIKIDNKLLTIPKDFVTDLASVPRPLWPLFPPQRSGFIAPSIVHDYLYYCDSGYTRKQADAIFFQALRKEDVSKLTAYKMWAGVRTFGNEYYLAIDCKTKKG